MKITATLAAPVSRIDAFNEGHPIKLAFHVGAKPQQLSMTPKEAADLLESLRAAVEAAASEEAEWVHAKQTGMVRRLEGALETKSMGYLYRTVTNLRRAGFNARTEDRTLYTNATVHDVVVHVGAGYFVE